MPTAVAWEFYSGIGGLHLALRRSGVNGEVVRAFDWDQNACRVYAANYGLDIVQKVDIMSLTASSLISNAPPADLWLLSPSCQPYTVLNPNAKGASDPRAKSFLHLIQSVLPDLVNMNTGVHPTRLLIENVAGFETSTTRQVLLTTLRSQGYVTMEFLLTPLQFGIPNSRLRYYLLAKHAPLSFPPSLAKAGNGDRIWRHIPGRETSDWLDPRNISPTNFDESARIAQVKQFLDEDTDPTDKTYVIPDRVLKKWGRLFDIVSPSSTRTCCFTRGYTQLVERAGSILQMNEDLDTTTVFDNFLQAQVIDESNALDILRPLKLRYFSLAELLRIFHFIRPTDADAADSKEGKPRDTFIWPESLSTKAKYRLIGNSVNVYVVTALIDFLYIE